MKAIQMIGSTVLLIAAAVSVSSCTGSRPSIRLSALEYPVSMSAYLFDSQGQQVVKGKDLKILGPFEYEKRFWGELWSFLQLSSDEDVSATMNEAVRTRNGDGIINLKAEASYCGLNAIPLVGILPIWPGCTLVKFSGEIVKLHGRQE